jgi:adenosylhomocysteine nucleosidase
MNGTADAPLGLICAIPEEIAHFGPHFQQRGTVEAGGFLFRTGQLDGVAAVLVEAGLGKVNAAVVSTLLIERLDCRALLFSGVAGGVDPALGIGDVVVSTRLVQHDYGALVDRALRVYQPGVPPLPGLDTTHGYDVDAALLARCRAALDGFALPPLSAEATGGQARTPRLAFGTIVTGDQFVNCEATRLRLNADFGALAVEMEGAAVAQVATRYGRPYVVVRSLSDLAGAESHMDFGAFAEAAAAGAAALIRRLAPAV